MHNFPYHFLIICIFLIRRIISNGRFSIVGENRKNCSPRLLILTELWPAVGRVQSWLNKCHRELALSLETISEPVSFEGNTTEAHIEVFIFVSFASLLRAFIHKHDTTSRSARTQRCFTMGRRVVEICWIIPWFSTKRQRWRVVVRRDVFMCKSPYYYVITVFQ